MATVDELREKAHEIYARARASSDPSTKQGLLNLADGFLKQVEELRRAHAVQATFQKSDKNIG
ncbi:MAG: hypothetical protein WB503_22475 [Pseudolabrys sp.]|jgi:hypothetical protein